MEGIVKGGQLFSGPPHLKETIYKICDWCGKTLEVAVGFPLLVVSKASFSCELDVKSTSLSHTDDDSHPNHLPPSLFTP